MVNLEPSKPTSTLNYSLECVPNLTFLSIAFHLHHTAHLFTLLTQVNHNLP